MARTESTMQKLGTPMPSFSLVDASGTPQDSANLQGPHGTLIMFICNHCPFVVHVADELGRLGRDCMERGVGVVGINSNDAENYPDDAPERMPAFASTHDITFPYLVDASQDTARDFAAACTPDFFLYDGSGMLIYRGQLDSSRPDNGIEVTGEDLRAAVDALLDGRPQSTSQQPSLGCNIKWKSCSNCCTSETN